MKSFAFCLISLFLQSVSLPSNTPPLGAQHLVVVIRLLTRDVTLTGILNLSKPQFPTCEIGIITVRNTPSGYGVLTRRRRESS